VRLSEVRGVRENFDESAEEKGVCCAEEEKRKRRSREVALVTLLM
jgi:hypothetical protein